MSEIRKELAITRALCHQLRNSKRFVPRLVTSLSSPHELQENTSTVSLASLTPIATNRTTVSGQSSFSTYSKRSSRSITSIASSYWAASIIDLYYSELEEISAQSSAQQRSTTGALIIQISGTVPDQISQPARIISQGESSRQTANTGVTVVLSFDEISPWPFSFPQPTDTSCLPIILATSAATENKYHFDGMLFYPAPELTPGAFTPLPGRNATVLQPDEYVQRCVQRNRDFVVGEVSYSLEFKRSIETMKLFWRCHALSAIRCCPKVL